MLKRARICGSGQREDTTGCKMSICLHQWLPAGYGGAARCAAHAAVFQWLFFSDSNERNFPLRTRESEWAFSVSCVCWDFRKKESVLHKSASCCRLLRVPAELQTQWFFYPRFIFVPHETSSGQEGVARWRPQPRSGQEKGHRMLNCFEQTRKTTANVHLKHKQSKKIKTYLWEGKSSGKFFLQMLPYWKYPPVTT